MKNEIPENPIFTYDKTSIQKIVQTIPQDIRRDFPDHIFEPERIEVARELVLKEYYKLFPSLVPADFAQMSDDILAWLAGVGYELAPVTDFWNYIDGMMLTLKLKDIVPQLTSGNITWTLENIALKDINLYAPIGNLAEHGKPPYTFDFINEKILQDKAHKEINLRISDEKSSHTVPRDHYPILVRRELDGAVTLLDGNRRVLRGLLYEKEGIDAWVGTVSSRPALQDHWVNTGILRRLLDAYQASSTAEAKKALELQLNLILQSSSIARHNFKTRCVPHYAFISELDLPDSLKK